MMMVKGLEMAKSTTWLVLTVVFGLTAPGAPPAQAQGDKASARRPLSAQDQVDIQQLVARYAYAYDTKNNNCLPYADLFTADGEFFGMRGHAKGREALAEYCRGGQKPANGVSHFIMNHVIEPAADGATGKQYLVVVNIGEGDRPGGEFSNTGGHYEDVYARTAQGWRFKRREFIPIASSPRPTPAAPSAAVALPAQQPRAVAGEPRRVAVAALTAQDYFDIRALANRYAYGLDSGADNGTGSVYANVFTEDAEFHGPPAVPGGTPFDAKGRDALRRFAVPGRGPAYVRHFMANHLIEPSAEGARGKVYLLVIDIGRDGKQTSVNMGGHYEDTYVKTAEGWRIKTRNFYRSKSAQTIEAEASAAAAKAPAQAR